jgi:AmmeMemoRadiSam system protein B
MAKGAWKTPMGDVPIDDRLSSCILSHSKHLQDDTLAHVYEHSLEVQLPFLQYFKDNFSIVPIVLASNRLDALKEIGREIAESIISLGLQKSVLIIASSDMTHYEPQQQAEKKDQQALQAILQLNEDALMDKIIKMKISMCGYAPVIAAISAAKALGAQKAVLVKYQTSGDVTHDKESVVGYAGVIIS